MRKVTFIINETGYFREIYKQKLTREQAENIWSPEKSFNAVYIMYGNGTIEDRADLTDYDGRKIDRENLNEFQKGIILAECNAYFENRLTKDADYPITGVVDITEEELYI